VAHRGLDLLDAPDDVLDLCARAAVEQGDSRTRPGGVPGCRDALGIAVGDEAQNERVDRVDVRPERAREPDPVHALDAVVLHQQRAARVERAFASWIWRRRSA
jgi:hypothetical protein